MTPLGAALQALILEHEYCGELDAAVEDDRVWMTCTCGAVINPQTMTDTRGQLLIAALVLFLGACAITNTPQQDLAYARWAKCNAPYVQLEQVDLDGRITFKISNEGSRQETLRCLGEAGRTGPPLPEPVVVRPSPGV